MGRDAPAFERLVPTLEAKLALVLAVVSACLLAGHATLLDVPIVDDAAISVAYAKTLFAGHGFRLTPYSTVVEGFSNPLWTLLVGLAFPLRLNALRFASGLSAVLMLASVPVYALWGAASRGRVCLEDACAPLLMALTSSFAYWGSSGMETSLFSLLLGLGGLFALRDLRRRRGVLAGVAFGLASLARPEGPAYALAAAVFWGGVLVSERRRPGRHDAATASLAIGIPAAYLAFRLAYFDAWVPNTALAKLGVDKVIRDLRESYALSAWSLSGRKRGRPTGDAMGGTSSRSGSSSLAFGTFAPLSSTASGIPWASTRMWCFVPGLPRSVGFGPTSSEPPLPRGCSSRRWRHGTNR